ncbi:MAG: nucleoside-diphosphate kinase [Euryarchaeota archaeon HGW-Euryarchaeota-1]|nr:MAG: nucleoside-diphosphate kinase [Euryarchaeota archaeon HGW-Euryarchaeota-1]
MALEQTLVLIKPDALQRGLAGNIITRFERKGLKIVSMKMIHMDEKLAEEHYAQFKIKHPEIFPKLQKSITSAPVIAIVLEGVDAVEAVRLIVGITKARGAEAGTIRGDLAMSIQNNVVHASDSSENAKKEIANFFKSDEIFNWNWSICNLIYTPDELA